MLRNILVILLTSFVIVSCSDMKTITIQGSETANPLFHAIIDDFEATNEGYKLTVKGGGTQSGIEALFQEEVDAAMISNPISNQDDANLRQNGKYDVATIGFDGVAIVVHPENYVPTLTADQVSAIFSGKVTNFKDVKGPDVPITVVMRNKDSGTKAYFTEYVLRKRVKGNAAYADNQKLGYVEKFHVVEDNIEMSEFIAENKGAIGYMGMKSSEHKAHERVKKVAFAANAGDKFYEPNNTNIRDRSYALSRELKLVYYKDNAKALTLIDYLISPKGQDKIASEGYLRAVAREIVVTPQK